MKTLLLLTAFLGAALGAAAQIPALTPVTRLEGDRYDWNARHARILREQAALNPEVVLLGDSICHHWSGINSIGGSDALPRLRLAFGTRRVLNLGFGWDRTGNILWRLQNGELAGLSPKLIVIQCGGNNFFRTARYAGDTPEDVAQGVLAVVRKAHELAPQAKVVLMGTFPFGRRPGDLHRAKIAQSNALLARAVSGLPYVTFIDLAPKLLDAGGHYPPALANDAIHPTDAGYAIWSAALAPHLKTLQ